MLPHHCPETRLERVAIGGRDSPHEIDDMSLIDILCGERQGDEWGG